MALISIYFELSEYGYEMVDGASSQIVADELGESLRGHIYEALKYVKDSTAIGTMFKEIEDELDNEEELDG
jgi:hypothetical protein